MVMRRIWPVTICLFILASNSTSLAFPADNHSESTNQEQIEYFDWREKLEPDVLITMAILGVSSADLHFPLLISGLVFSTVPENQKRLEEALAQANQFYEAAGWQNREQLMGPERFNAFARHCFEIRNARMVRAAVAYARTFEKEDAFFESANKIANRVREAIAVFSKNAEATLEQEYPNHIERELAHAYELDQGIAILWGEISGWGLTSSGQSFAHELRSLSTCRINFYSAELVRNIMQEIGGWPKRSEYGRDVENWAFMIVHNTGHDLPLLEWILEELDVLKELDKEVARLHYPNLYDIVAMYNNRPQRYGWWMTCVDGRYQVINGLEDPEHVNEYRAKFRLPTIEERIAELNSQRKCE